MITTNTNITSSSCLMGRLFRISPLVKPDPQRSPKDKALRIAGKKLFAGWMPCYPINSREVKTLVSRTQNSHVCVWQVFLSAVAFDRLAYRIDASDCKETTETTTLTIIGFFSRACYMSQCQKQSATLGLNFITAQ